MKTKLFILTTRYPLPAFGGDTLRIVEIAEYLSRYFEVTLLCVDNNNKRDIVLERELSFAVITFKQTYFDKVKGGLNLLLLRRTLQNAYYECGVYTNFVKSLDFGGTKFLVHLTRSMHFLPKDQWHKNVLEMTDATSYSYRKKCFKKFLAKPSLSLAQFLDSFGTRKFEKTAMKLFKNVVLVSERDKAYFNSDLISVIKNGVQVCDRHVLPAQYKNSFVFVGNLYSLSNWSGLESFIKNEFRNLKKLDSSFSLHVVGAAPANVKLKLEKVTGVFVHNNVAHLHHFISQFEIGICPIYFAGGMQNKVLDYLSAGIEAIVTKETCMGLPQDLQPYVRVYENSQEFIKMIVESKIRLCPEARLKTVDYMKSNYGWNAKLSGYEKLW